jgi:uncharacterized lipoprotein NlpE involved in copper resistance
MLNNISILKKNLVTFVVVGLFLYGCNNKPPYEPDYENAIGFVIGSENCKNDTAQNAWFIQFPPGPHTRNKYYGENITYNNTSYSNVVKTYTLPDTSKIAGKRYLFEFYIEDKPMAQPCDVQNPLNLIITNIRIKRLFRVVTY